MSRAMMATRPEWLPAAVAIVIAAALIGFLLYLQLARNRSN